MYIPLRTGMYQYIPVCTATRERRVGSGEPKMLAAAGRRPAAVDPGTEPTCDLRRATAGPAASADTLRLSGAVESPPARGRIGTLAVVLPYYCGTPVPAGALGRWRARRVREILHVGIRDPCASTKQANRAGLALVLPPSCIALWWRRSRSVHGAPGNTELSSRRRV